MYLLYVLNITSIAMNSVLDPQENLPILQLNIPLQYYKKETNDSLFKNYWKKYPKMLIKKLIANHLNY